MLELQDDILLEWGKRLRATVKEAEQLPHPILINTFPMLYKNLAEAITPGFPRKTAAEANSVASEHGGERARLTDYKVRAVISEYQLLRWTIFDVLEQNGVRLGGEEVLVINASIDEAIRESVTAFSLAQSALRERFVAALTHDLRTPLAAAHTAAELLRQGADTTRTKALAGQVIDNLTRMDGMIQDLLDAIVFQSGERLRLHPEHFDILQLAKEVCDQFAATHGAHIRLSGAPVAGWWDRKAIKRAIENLVGNALKYGDAGRPVRVGIESNHQRMMLTVHNEGEPIPADQLEVIFQVFRRALAAMEGDKQGWGIGLPYARSVAESHGGSIGVDSAMERGTSFFIDLPVDARPYQGAPTLGQG